MDSGELKSHFGPLGPIPKEIIYGPAGSGLKWKDLSERAKKCLKMRNKEARLAEAERINKAYYDLIEECRDYVARTSES